MKKFLAILATCVAFIVPAHAEHFGAECFVSKITPPDPQGTASKVNVYWEIVDNTLNVWVFHTLANGEVKNRFNQYSNTRVWLGNNTVNWDGWLNGNHMGGILDMVKGTYVELLKEGNGHTVKIESACHPDHNQEKFWAN